MDIDKPDHKKVWGCGYFAGIRASESLSYLGYEMNQRKYSKLTDAQTMTARKVLECVPADRESNKKDINAVVRTLGISITPAIVEGCLYSLRDDGLIKEGKRGFFIRVVPSSTVKKIATIVKKVVPVIEPEPEEAITKMVKESYESVAVRDPIEVIEEMTVAMSELMSKFEMAALEISEYVQKSENDVKKMKQLQTLLSSLGE